jgi:hypothetical protein
MKDYHPLGSESIKPRFPAARAASTLSFVASDILSATSGVTDYNVRHTPIRGMAEVTSIHVAHKHKM